MLTTTYSGTSRGTAEEPGGTDLGQLPRDRRDRDSIKAIKFATDRFTLLLCFSSNAK
jgi:hypothetical protein